MMKSGMIVSTIEQTCIDDSSPVLLNPVSRADVFIDAFVPGSWPNSVHGFVRIRLARESHKFSSARQEWLAEPASDTAWHAVTFETATPVGWPEVHGSVETRRNVRLRIRIRCEYQLKIFKKSGEDFWMAADGESIG